MWKRDSCNYKRAWSQRVRGDVNSVWVEVGGCVDNWVLIKCSIFRYWERRDRQGLTGLVGDRGRQRRRRRHEIWSDTTGQKNEAVQQWGSQHPLPNYISISPTWRILRKRDDTKRELEEERLQKGNISEKLTTVFQKGSLCFSVFTLSGQTVMPVKILYIPLYTRLSN